MSALCVLPVAAPEDPRLAGYRLVARPGELRRAGWFVAEGRLVVERALSEPGYAFHSLLLSPSALAQLEPLLERRGFDAPLYVCPAGLLEPLTGHDFHRGCLALVRRPAPRDFRELCGRARVLVVLEGVANADNVGGVFRNAAAFGADAVLLDPSSADPLYRKAIRTSMGASLRVPFATLDGEPGWPECLGELARLGFTLLALTPAADAREIDEFAASPDRPRRLALLFGAEGPGLSPRAIAFAAQRLKIAIRPEVDSLNLAVACGVALQRLMPR